MRGIMNKLDLIYGPDCVLAKLYGKEPLRVLYDRSEELFKPPILSEDSIGILNNKILNACRKLYMLHTAGNSILKVEQDFRSSQNPDCPVLIWEDEIIMLYHIEAMILFARSALDIGTYIFSNLLFEPYGQNKLDSFNEFSKDLLKCDNKRTIGLREKIKELEDIDLSWYRLLCGSQRGRALRDKIAHQTVVNIKYLEVEGRGEKRYCHIIINDNALPIKLFINNITLGVYDFFLTAENSILEIWG